MNTDTDEIVARQVTVLRIIVAALIAGVAVFAFVVIFVLWGVVPANDQFQVMTYLGLGMLVMSIGLQSRLDLFEPPASATTTPAEELNRWVAGYAQRTIIGASLFEAPAFLCVMASMLDGRPWGLLGAAAAVALMIAWRWPTPARLNEHIEKQLARARNAG
ncbi:MAG: hypothetical protein K1X57_15090 [Gemmataceae bacterium]|nr:hypothetical protein [Gemmataceae bacterium]